MSVWSRQKYEAWHQLRLIASLAHARVREAILRGELARLPNGTLCVDCRVVPALQYDHRDYSKPLEVEPVCRRCNRRRGPARYFVRTP